MCGCCSGEMPTTFSHARETNTDLEQSLHSCIVIYFTIIFIIGRSSAHIRDKKYTNTPEKSFFCFGIYCVQCGGEVVCSLRNCVKQLVFYMPMFVEYFFFLLSSYYFYIHATSMPTVAKWNVEDIAQEMLYLHELDACKSILFGYSIISSI